MRWEKIGLIFVAERQFQWMQSHAAWPKALNLDGDIFRIYFSTRDDLNRSHIAFIDINIYNPFKIISISKNPVLSPQESGKFDNHGVIPSCILKYNNKFLLYYTGVSKDKIIPYTTFCGLSQLNITKDIAFRISTEPLLKKNDVERLSCGGCAFVLYDESKCSFQMWYESCLEWESNGYPCFEIKYAVSENGANWIRKNITSIRAQQIGGCVSNPSVIKEMDCYKMWYSFKVEGKYRIGYAESSDGASWVRKDSKVGIHISNEGWDSDEIEYPNVFDHNGVRYMLYNGNCYGKTGFGLAKLVVN